MGRRGRGGVRTVAVLVVSAAAVHGFGSATAGASATSASPTARELRGVADDLRAATNAPGAIVAVQRGGQAPVLVARGTRDRRGGGRLRTDDPFVVASVSKAFTAAVVLGLVEQGKLRLDDRVADDVPGWDRRIRIRQLLNHTSGLPSWGNKDDRPDSPRAALENADLSRRFTMAEGLEPVRTMPLLAAPGTKTHYSNANSILAGLVVEAVTGAPLVDAYHRYVLDPLRLRSTAYPPQETPPRPPIPGVLYVDDAKTELDTAQYPQESNLTLGGPAAGMVSDAPDLLTFAKAFLRGDFPNRRLGRAVKRIDPGGAGLGVIGFTGKGACIFDGCPPGRHFPRLAFAGNGPGTAVRVVHDPRTDTTVLVFANSSERGKLDPFVDRVLDRLG
jgi:D-alanyl-D-alanine carboxypeptidase